MRERYRGVQSETASSQQSLKGQVQQLSTALQSAQQQMGPDMQKSFLQNQMEKLIMKVEVETMLMMKSRSIQTTVSSRQQNGIT